MDINTVYPARGYLLVTPNPRKAVTDGGIITLDPKTTKAKIAVENGLVMAVGLPPRNKKGVEFPWPEDLKAEATVYYTWTAGTEVKTPQGTFLLLLHNEIIMVE